MLNLKKIQINLNLKSLEYPLDDFYTTYTVLDNMPKKKQTFFRLLKKVPLYNFSNKGEGDFGVHFCPKKFKKFTINKFLTFRSNFLRIKNRFNSYKWNLHIFNNRSFSLLKRFKKKNKTLFAKTNFFYIKYRKPVVYILRAIDKIRWVFTTQLRRMGKYFHNIPTTITFPRTLNYGLKKLSFILNTNVKNRSYIKKLNLEIFCILFRFKRSISRYIRRLKLKLFKKNLPYSHFRWK